MTSAWDPYTVLGLARNADEVTTRARYRERAMECHPDRPGGSTARMQAVNRAFGILSDPRARAAWDAAAHKDAGDANRQARSDPRPSVWAPGARRSSGRTQRRDRENHWSAGWSDRPAGTSSSQEPSRNVASGLCQWSAVAVFVAGTQELTIGGGEALMAVAAAVLAVYALGRHRDAGQPFWPARDAKLVVRKILRIAFAGVR